MFLYQKYTELGNLPDFEGMVRRPYTQLPTRKVIANPILLLLNLIHQFEKTFTQKYIPGSSAVV